jgi:hypothetical protein
MLSAVDTAFNPTIKPLDIRRILSPITALKNALPTLSLSGPNCVPHGLMPCGRCWKGTTTQTRNVGDFRLVRDPGHAGSSNPSVLVLGVSKGRTQSEAIANGDFDKVGFKDCRDRLLKILQTVGLLSRQETEQNFDLRFTAGGRDYAFASVVRCSLTGLNRENKYTADSPSVFPAFKPGSAAYPFIEACVDQHIGRLPPATRTVVLLGTTEIYIKRLGELIGRRLGGVTPISEVAYRAGGVLFVHVTHPSRGNGNFGAFISGEGPSGAKMRLATAAIRRFKTAA